MLTADARARTALPGLPGLALSILQDLIRIDTSNPPGNELAAAQYLAARLTCEGLTCQIVEPAPGRGNLIARLPATTKPSAGPLLLIGHLDCAPFDPSEWAYRPLDASIADGAVWGRGAINCKGPLAVWSAILAQLARLDRPRHRDAVLVAGADAFGRWTHGMSWIRENMADCLAGDAALGEGGGWPLHAFGKTYYTYQCSEKGVVKARLAASGQVSAVPTRYNRSVAGGNPLFLLGRALGVVERLDLPLHVTPCFQAFVEALAAPQPLPASSHIRSLLSPLLAGEALSRVAADTVERSVLLALARNTVAPAAVTGSSRHSSTPAPVEIVLDCRMLPGQTVSSLCAELEAALEEGGLPVNAGDAGLSIEVLAEEIVPPSESPPDADIVALMGQAVSVHHPGSHLVPLMAPGPSSSRFTRMAGTPTYGFFPTLPEVDLSGGYGANERIPLASLKFAVDVLWDVMGGYVCGPAHVPLASA